MAAGQKRSFESPPSPEARRKPPLGAIVRIAVLAVLVVAAAAWALVDHYTSRPPPLRVPVAHATAPTYDADGGEIPAPETIGPEGG